MVRALAFTARTGKAWRLGTVAVGKLQLAGHGERALSTMAATSACGWRARERVESEPETIREAEGRVNEARALPITLGKAGRVARAWTCGCTAWSPRRHFTEHMSCEEVAGVGRVFGLVPG